MRLNYCMKLPAIFNSVKLVIPAAIFILVLGWFISRIPQMRSATIENPQGTEKVMPTPSALPVKINPILDLKTQLEKFVVDDSAYAMPVFEKQINLPSD